MKKYILGLVLLAMFVLPLAYSANAVTIAELQALIASLTAQLKALQTQPIRPPCGFHNDLSVGDGENDGLTNEVLALQERLISSGYLNIKKPTGFFGKLTMAAVKQWQTDPVIRLVATGAIGSAEREKLCGGNSGSTITIKSVSGPTSLNVGQTGTWSVNATAPSGTNMTYSVVWGDEPVNYKAMATSGSLVSQSASFTHVYNTAGTYTPTFSVYSGREGAIQTSLTVVVGNVTSSIKPMVFRDILKVKSVIPPSIANLGFGVYEVSAQYNLGTYHRGQWYEGLNPDIYGPVWVEFGWPNSPNIDVILLDENSIERKIYLPAVGANTVASYYWIAEDGSSYYANTGHGPGWPNLSSNEALTSEHLARKAPSDSITALLAQIDSLTKYVRNNCPNDPVPAIPVNPTVAQLQQIIASLQKQITICQNSHVPCQDLYWRDDTNSACEQKQFCGMYMYQTLRTFNTQAECLAGGASSAMVVTQLGSDPLAKKTVRISATETTPDVVLGVFDLKSQDQSSILANLRIRANGTRITNARLYDGSTLVGQATLTGEKDRWANFFAVDIPLAKDQWKTLTFKADIPPRTTSSETFPVSSTLLFNGLVVTDTSLARNRINLADVADVTSIYRIFTSNSSTSQTPTVNQLASVLAGIKALVDQLR